MVVILIACGLPAGGGQHTCFSKINPSRPSCFVWSLNALGVCYINIGRREEAFSAWKQALQQSPNNFFPHLNMADAYIQMGREKEARSEAAEVLRINPNFSLDNYAKACYAFKDQMMINRYIGNLRKTGLKWAFIGLLFFYRIL